MLLTTSSSNAAARPRASPRGTLVLKSTYHGAASMDTAPWVINEITVVGSRCGRFEPALDALASGRIDPLPLVDAVFPASRAIEAMSHAQKPGVFKILIDFNMKS
jgi:threonine dehydrogenase-like Zn-dependent dehydrogenase